MSLLRERTLASCIGEAFAAGSNLHGNLGLSVGRYSERINDVLERSLGAKPVEHQAVSLFEHLHTADLYLTTACALPSEAAWGRFDHLYRRLLQRVSAGVCGTKDAAGELAEGLAAYLFLPDQAGRSRIAGFDGRSSLASWLSAIINHQAANERRRRCNATERLEEVAEMADEIAVCRIENKLRADRYWPIIKATFTTAGQQLSEQERLILVLRHEEGLQGAEIAHLLRLHPSTISRQLHGIYEKLREVILSTLDTQHHLNTAAIEECVAETLAHPGGSVRALFQIAD
jgi:RNA polymerase sigma-70 factor